MHLISIFLDEFFLTKYFEPFQLGNGDTFLKIYDGGSNKDVIIYDGFQHNNSDTVTSMGNQMFITFKPDVNGVGKNFTANITFGIRTNY